MFTRWQKARVDRHTRAGSEKESRLCGSLNHLYGGNSSGFPLADHLALPGSVSIFGLSQGPPLCVHASFSQMDSKGFWKIDQTYYGLAPPPFSDLWGAFLCTCVVWEVSLTSRRRNVWSLYLSSKQDSAPPCSCHYLYLGVSAWGPSISCLRCTFFSIHKKKKRKQKKPPACSLVAWVPSACALGLENVCFEIRITSPSV